MRSTHLVYITFVGLFCQIISCSPEKTKTTVKYDPHSYAQPDQALVTHLQWTATVNFEKKIISATAIWSVDVKPDADLLTLDTKDLTIEEVWLDDHQHTEFRLSDKDPILGQALAILIKPGTKKVGIRYTTSPEAEALQWLTAQQTADKLQPYLFTQSQAILARSWIPCQDSPGIRFSYSADVSVPPSLLALMSASNPQQKNNSGTYHFEMKQAISSYLLALAVGDVSFKPVSDRTGVYAEPSLVDTVAWEFEDLEKMVTATEELYGHYPWERYDVIVLPPSFPFGGMENPRLTFATPTILAGDRSLISLIAHELAHSWSGNLVTNATWNDFWLNEGFTVYVETRIMEKLYGRDYSEMLASLNLHDLKETIQSLNDDGKPQDTKLKLDLEGRNPDDGVTDIAYNKGYFFLRTLEEKYGREKFDAFLQHYFEANAFKSMDTEGFIRFIKNFYKTAYTIDIPDDQFTRWIYTEGLPDECPQPHSNRFAKVDTALSKWKSDGVFDQSAAKAWSTHEWLHFIKSLPDTLTKNQLEVLDDFGGFTSSGNAEIITAWGVVAIKNGYTKAYPNIENFLIHTGRRKFLMPLYNEMLKTVSGKQWATKVYEKARPNYHFVATSSLDPLISH